MRGNLAKDWYHDASLQVAFEDEWELKSQDMCKKIEIWKKDWSDRELLNGRDHHTSHDPERQLEKVGPTVSGSDQERKGESKKLESAFKKPKEKKAKKVKFNLLNVDVSNSL